MLMGVGTVEVFTIYLDTGLEYVYIKTMMYTKVTGKQATEMDME